MTESSEPTTLSEKIRYAIIHSDCYCKPGDPTCADWVDSNHRWNAQHVAVMNVLKREAERPQSNLVDHAKLEFEILGEDPEVVEPVLRMIQIFADMGHSGASAYYCRDMLNDLLSFKNLSPLTNDSSEWTRVSEEIWPPDGIWQNRRNPKAFSNDGGATYYLISEGGNDQNREANHISEKKCGPTDDPAVCACGCSGYDDRCVIWSSFYQGNLQVPKRHTCCKIPGRE